MRYEIYVKAPYEFTYAELGQGYCSDYKYVPGGSELLLPTDLLYNVDRIRECGNRCY